MTNRISILDQGGLSVYRWIAGAAAIMCAVGAGAMVMAQDSSLATPTSMACATPVAGTPMPAVATAVAGTPEAPAEGCASPVTEPAAEIVIEMVDIAFLPNEIVVPADTLVTIMLPNRGGATHNFYLDELGIESADATSGTTLSVTFTAPAGSYEFYCNIPGHKQAGMVGTLIVE